MFVTLLMTAQLTSSQKFRLILSHPIRQVVVPFLLFCYNISYFFMYCTSYKGARNKNISKFCFVSS